MLLIDGELHKFQPLPSMFFGHQKPLAYVFNPKVASTLMVNFIFYVNHGYRYFATDKVHLAPAATRRLDHDDINPQKLDLLLRLKAETFTIVRDPLKRFVSAFISKVYTDDDPWTYAFRDQLTSLHGTDLSPEANPAQSCLALARYVAAQENLQEINPHFRPQYLNLAIGSRFKIDTILRIEERDVIKAYCAKWVGQEKAERFLNLRFNESRFNTDDFVSDELVDVVRQFYARDYELFYS
jgi:hypothetical protein